MTRAKTPADRTCFAGTTNGCTILNLNRDYPCRGQACPFYKTPEQKADAEVKAKARCFRLGIRYRNWEQLRKEFEK